MVPEADLELARAEARAARADARARAGEAEELSARLAACRTEAETAWKEAGSLQQALAEAVPRAALEAACRRGPGPRAARVSGLGLMAGGL